MKNIWMGLLVLLASSHGNSQQLCMKDLIGRWEASGGAGLEIIDSSRIFITYGNERRPILSYKADFSRVPCWFDFVVKDTAQQLSTMKSLLMLGKDVLMWQVFEGGERPSDFAADDGQIVILRRKK